MSADPYCWHYRCGESGMVTRLPLVVPDEKAERIIAEKTVSKFPCRFCGKEHDGYLERSPFGNE